MNEGNRLVSRLLATSPLEVVASRPLFRSAAIRWRMAGSLIRLTDGRLLLAFRQSNGPDRRNDGAIMLSSSADDGEQWEEPWPVYAYPGWDCIPMGGLFHYADDQIVLILGRIQLDLTLAGDEPATGWYTTSVHSRDGGRTWSEPGPEIRLFPCWTELYGASNPHPLGNGRYLVACTGTLGRDAGWRAGVTTTDATGQVVAPATIIAAAPDRHYSDTDLIRLTDGRFLAVCREDLARASVFSHSADEGRTWSAVQRTGFQGSNIKLLRLRSGAILCAYRDEDPARRGVSCSLSEDGGTTWRFIGQLYDAGPGARHRPGAVCGYPDFVTLGPTDLGGILHTYPDAAGRVDLHWLRLRDRST